MLRKSLELLATAAFGIALVTALYIALIWSAPVLMRYSASNGAASLVESCKKSPACRGVSLTNRFDSDQRRPVYVAVLRMKASGKEAVAIQKRTREILNESLERQPIILRWFLTEHSAQLEVRHD